MCGSDEGEDVTGRVVLKGTPQFAAGLQVALEPADDPIATANAVTGENGQFHWKSVLPGVYRVTVNGAPAGLYVKSVRIGDVEAQQRALDYSRGVYPAEITVVLSANGGTLKGSAKNDSGARPGGVQVVALSASGDLRGVRSAVSDQSGQFEIRGLAPVDYRVLAFEDLEPGAAEDASFMQRFAAHSRSVKLAEKQNETVEMSVIPTEGSQPQP